MKPGIVWVGPVLTLYVLGCDWGPEKACPDDGSGLEMEQGWVKEAAKTADGMDPLVFIVTGWGRGEPARG